MYNQNIRCVHVKCLFWHVSHTHTTSILQLYARAVVETSQPDTYVLTIPPPDGVPLDVRESNYDL